MSTKPLSPRALGRELRFAESDDLARRRAVIGLSLASAAVMGVITLYQTGLIKHLPEPPIKGLDADRVNGSSEAYKTLAAPDALLGLNSYATTAVLAAIGGKHRAAAGGWTRFVPLALAGKAAFDAAQAAKLTVDQWTKHRAFCLYCLTAAAATFAVLPLTLPEAWRAIRNLRDQTDR